MGLLEQVLNPGNMASAQKRVIANKGEAGVDGMKVSGLNAYMAENRTFITESIENGTYQPQAVLGVEIDKASGGKRLLGIPTVIDRTIQQAIQQVLSPIYDAEFSAYSYGLFTILFFFKGVHELPLVGSALTRAHIKLFRKGWITSTAAIRTLLILTLKASLMW